MNSTTYIINRPAVTDDYGNVVGDYLEGPATGADSVYGPNYWGDGSTLQDATEAAVELMGGGALSGWTHLHDYATGRTWKLGTDVCEHGNDPDDCFDCARDLDESRRDEAADARRERLLYG